MGNNAFNYYLSNNTLVFTDTLKKNSPYIADIPRNHESLFFVTNGTMLYEKKDEKTIITEGQVGYIERGSIDSSSAYLCDEVSYIAVNFSFDNDVDFPQKTLAFKTLCSNWDTYKYEKLFKNALNYFNQKTPGNIVLCNSVILNIIGFLYDEHAMNIEQFSKKQQIEQAIQYLNKNFTVRDLKVSHLADMVHMSEKNFRRIFYAVYNETPYAYLQKLRISNAEILLLNTSKSVSDIALQCGFSDVYSFSHSFKKNIGISPTEYRVSNI